MSKDIDKHYRRLSARTWIKKARDYGWGLDGIAWAVRRWQSRHPESASPFLLCRNCDDPVLDPVLKRFKCRKDGETPEIGDMLDHSPESFARVPCYTCGGRKRTVTQLSRGTNSHCLSPKDRTA